MLLTELTAPTLRALEAIEEHVAETGRAPTHAEIAIRAGWATRAAARYHVLRLAEAGVLAFEPRSPRSIRLLATREQVQRRLREMAAPPPPHAV